MREIFGTYLVRERVDRNSKRPCQSKIAQLELPLAIDKKVLGLEITVQDTVLVAERSALQELVHETSNSGRVESATITVLIHVLLEILVTVLEYKNEFRLRVYNVVKAHDVDVLQLLHKGDFPNGSRWRAFLCVQMDLLQSDDFIGGPGAPLCERW